MEVIKHNNYHLAYKKYGNGLPPLLLFHGFGQSHKSFEPLISTLNNQYTCYSFDIFHHGSSKAPGNKSIYPQDWKDIINKFLEKEKIGQFSLGGFSLGGKYVLATLIEKGQQIENLILIAPDGIKSNFWYNLATHPKPLRKLFRSMIRYPQRFYVISRSLRRLGIIKKPLARFIEKQMHSPTQRAKIYETWVSVRPLKFKLSEIKNKIIDNNISTTIFLAKKDNIIPVKPFIPFCKNLPNCNLQIMDCKHYDLIRNASRYYSER